MSRDPANNTESLKNFKEDIANLLILSQTAMQEMYAHGESERRSIIIDQAKEMTTRIDEMFKKLTIYKYANPNSYFDTIALARAYYYIIKGYNYINKNGSENCALTDICIKCIKLLERKELDPRAIVTAMTVYITLANTYITVDYTKVIDLLNYAVNLFLAYTEEKDDYLIPISIEIIYGYMDNEDTRATLENFYIDCLLLLAKLHKRGGVQNIHLSMIYMNYALKKQLNLMDEIHTNYFSWISKSLKLFQYLARHSRFVEARKYLIAAELFLNKFYQKNCISTNPEHFLNEVKYKFGKFKICYYWIKYGIFLLRLSKERLLKGTYYKPSNLIWTCGETSMGQSTSSLIFNINIHPKEVYIMTDKYILNSTDARQVLYTAWIISMYCLDNEWILYNIDKNSENSIRYYLHLVSAICKIIKYFTWYIQDRNEQIEWIKKKIKILNILIDIIKILNPTTDIKIFQRIFIELATSYSILVDIMIERRSLTTKTLPVDYSQEVQNLMEQSISYFQEYFTSLPQNTR